MLKIDAKIWGSLVDSHYYISGRTVIVTDVLPTEKSSGLEVTIRELKTLLSGELTEFKGLSVKYGKDKETEKKATLVQISGVWYSLTNLRRLFNCILTNWITGETKARPTKIVAYIPDSYTSDFTLVVENKYTLLCAPRLEPVTNLEDDEEDELEED